MTPNQRFKQEAVDTCDVDLYKVVVVFDTELHLTAVHACVAGAQLRYPDAGVLWSLGVVQQLNSVQITFADAHLPPQSHQDGGDILLGDEAPLDAMRQGWNDGGSGVRNSMILQRKHI